MPQLPSAEAHTALRVRTMRGDILVSLYCDKNLVIKRSRHSGGCGGRNG